MPGYKRTGAKKIGKTTATKGMPKKKKTKSGVKKYKK